MAIVGHEMGHIRNSDTLSAMRKAYLTSAARNALGATGGVIGSLSGSQWGSLAEKFGRIAILAGTRVRGRRFQFRFFAAQRLRPVCDGQRPRKNPPHLAAERRTGRRDPAIIFDAPRQTSAAPPGCGQSRCGKSPCLPPENRPERKNISLIGFLSYLCGAKRGRTALCRTLSFRTVCRLQTTAANGRPRTIRPISTIVFNFFNINRYGL